MLPPILEIYIVWHPGDEAGQEIAEQFVEHFHGTVFSGLIGGAIEVYVRNAGWHGEQDAPRPIPLSTEDSPAGIRPARFIAIVPLAGNELAHAVETGSDSWHSFIETFVNAQDAEPKKVAVFPCLLDAGSLDQTILGSMISRFQCIAAGPVREGDTSKALRCRDLAQGIAQFLSPQANSRLRVFISHTKRNSPKEEKEDVEALMGAVRDVIATTRLQEFFDASDLQPGGDWDEELRTNAKTSALLAIRTDLYPSREWCQREILIAKRAGMPVVIVDALTDAEERGSFLMDHVPRMPARMSEGQWRRSDIYGALNLLVDESLKRIIWEHQKNAAENEIALKIAWWAPHAPEPITLSRWLEEARRANNLPAEGDLLILHPDPPLGPEEKSVLQELLSLGGTGLQLDVMTPRLFAARNG